MLYILSPRRECAERQPELENIEVFSVLKPGAAAVSTSPFNEESGPLGLRGARAPDQMASPFSNLSFRVMKRRVTVLSRGPVSTGKVGERELAVTGIRSARHVSHLARHAASITRSASGRPPALPVFILRVSVFE